ncbi:MAG: hypothetical protein QOH49_1668 [Acidobacteriota bacterium]|jgi:hypothetical protein|nr:hypothetical protein [Acidobacteriota bacterium]
MFRARAISLVGSFLLLIPCVPVEAQEGRGARPLYAPFGVEVLVEGAPLEALYGRGRRYVEASEGAEYELLVHNPLPVRVAVALSVDGLNTIDARHTSAWESSKWVIEPYGSIRVSGWQMSSSRARHFYFTTERDSYAARLGRASDLGVITAVFFRESTPRPYPVTPPPPYERDSSREHSGAHDEGERRSQSEAGKSRGSGATAAIPRDDGYAATGIGRSVGNSVEWIQLPLERTPAAELNVRYEYRAALVRLGLLPRPWHDDGALRRRERARGFEEPRYSPEPRF